MAPEPGAGLGVEPNPEPKLLPVLDPVPELPPKLELPTGVVVLLAGWPMLPPA